METPKTVQNPDTKTRTDTHDLELNSSFLLHNGFNHNNNNNNKSNSTIQISDIEMITIQSVTYTSLKDLLPTSPPSIVSPTHNNSSWHEIPIKNPLVKQAALAYLQPMSTPPEVGDKGFFGRLKDMFCSECGCFGWLNDIVLKPLKEAFCWERREYYDYYYDDDDEKLE